jgi:glycosyltransferase involved in cell wall biosynthesis
MKIIIATPLYPPEIGGPATYTRELVERLHNQHELTIIAYTNNNESFPGSTLVPINKSASLIHRLLAFTKQLYRIAKAADVIYVQNAVAAGLPAMIVGKLRRKPVILKFVGDEAWERASQSRKTKKLLVDFLEAPDGGFKITLMRWLQGFVLRNVTLVTTPSEYLGHTIQKAYRIDPTRVQTNYNAADKTTEAPFPAEPKQHQIVATARLVEWKCIDGIIEAVAMLKQTYPDIKAVICGDGPEKERLEQMARERNVSEQITFTGKVSRAETWQHRKESELYVLNSTYEGLPHTALTSFAAEIPMVATNTPGTNEAVYHEENGLLIEQNNPQQLTDAVARLFEDKELQHRLVTGGNKILKEKFSWDAHLATLNSFFEKVRSL